jgi:hypothetical protein
MADPETPEVTLHTLHDDLAGGFAEMRAGFADLRGEVRAGFADIKTTLVAGFRNLPTRESSEEMVRLLREANRLQEDRFTRLDIRIREQHLEAQQVLRALLEGQRIMIDGQHTLSVDLRALVARIDALLRGRRNGDRAD